jgi:hypothetical protein
MADIKIAVRKISRSKLTLRKFFRSGLRIKKLKIATSTKRKRFSQDFSVNRSKRFIAMEHLKKEVRIQESEVRIKTEMK